MYCMNTYIFHDNANNIENDQPFDKSLQLKTFEMYLKIAKTKEAPEQLWTDGHAVGETM